jgi:hypothetical protein
MVGFFYLPAIVLWCAWSHKKTPVSALIRVASHVLLFAAIFVAANPLLLVYPTGVLDGWRIQQQANIGKGPGRAAWITVAISDRGLGFAGTGLAMLGLVRTAIGRRFDGRAMALGMALTYLGWCVLMVNNVFPRFFYPALSPLLFGGLSALAPTDWPWRRSAAWASAALLGLVFATVDAPRFLRAIHDDTTFYQRNMTPEREEVGRRLLTLSKTSTGSAVTSFYTYVPNGVPWRPIWTTEEPFAKDAMAIVIDSTLKSGTNYRRLISGELGFAATATVGEFVIYRPASSATRR